MLAGRTARTAAARSSELGVQIMTMGQLAARLAGGLLRPVDLEVLQEAISAALPVVDMGDWSDRAAARDAGRGDGDLRQDVAGGRRPFGGDTSPAGGWRLAPWSRRWSSGCRRR